MKRAFVIGHPIGHSRSPLIHGYWLRHHGIEGSYEPIEMPPGELPGFFERIREGEFVGGNVTVPHKEAAHALCDTHDLNTAHIEATNTLTAIPTAEHGFLVHGTNTDYHGFLANLDASAPGWSDDLTTAVVLGAGGAARAVASAIADRGAGRVVILNRTPQKAEALAAELPGSFAAAPLSSFARYAPTSGLVVNTTTIGMHGTRFDDMPLGLLPSTALVTDIVYTPLETPLLAEARALGLKTVDGLGMLLHQAVPGFESWFGVRPEVTSDLRELIEGTL